MVKTGLLGKRARLPSAKTRRGHRHPVDAAALDRLIPTDLLEAFTAEQLAGARHVLDVREPVVVMRAVFDKRRSGDAE